MTKKIFCYSITIFCLLFSNGYTQIKSHQIGRLWTTMFPVGTLPDYLPLQNQMNYPGGDFFLHTGTNMDRKGLWIGVKNWTNKFNQFKTFYVSEGGYKNFEAPDVLQKLSNKKQVRQRLPLVDVNGAREQRVLDTRTSSSLKIPLPADEVIITEWTTDVGIEVTRTSYAFANPRHDSYIIQEHVFKNTGNVDKDGTIELKNQNLEDVYFGFWRTFVPSGDVGHQKNGGEHDDWCHYYGNQPGDSLQGFWYVYDGDSQHNVLDDIGDPSDVTGELLSPQYPAFGVLHADTDYLDETNNPDQPVTANYWPDRLVHSHTQGDPDQTLYFDLNSGTQSQGSDAAGYTDSWDPQIQRPQLLVSFGPYNIPFGEDIRIVIFEAVGSISRHKAIDYGRMWKNGEISDLEKNDFVSSGLDTLHQIVKRAQWTWEHGIEAVPDGPEAPNLRVDAGPGKIELEWYYGNYDPAGFLHDTTPPDPDVDTGVYDFSGYRLFRAEESYTNVYNKIFECGGNSGVPVTNKYTDRNVKRGENYFYYVVAFDDGSQNTSDLFFGQPTESSHFSNRNYMYAAVPFKGARTKLDSIFVVPNPFHAQGLAYGGTIQEDYIIYDIDLGVRIEDKITFVGLPAKAVITIFTAHGDLVARLEHPNPYNPASVPESADEMWFQVSDSRQTIKSGVYFYHVEGWDFEDNFLGTTTGKFVVIR